MKTLIMLPGMMCDERLFAPQIAHLSGDYDVQVLSIAGFSTMAELAADVLQQAPAEFALLGLSMGGIVAMEVVKQGANRVSHLALVDTNPRSELEAVKMRRGPQIEKVLNGDLSLVMSEQMIPHYLYDRQSQPEIEDLCMDMAKKLGPKVFVNQSQALRDRPDYQEVLRRYQGKALVLCGREDRLCPLERHRLMQELMTDADLQIIDEAGHLPSLEKPAQVNHALDLWLHG